MLETTISNPLASNPFTITCNCKGFESQSLPKKNTMGKKGSWNILEESDCFYLFWNSLREINCKTKMLEEIQQHKNVFNVFIYTITHPFQ